MRDPATNGRMNNVDAAFIYLERKEIPLNIGALGIFEKEIPFEPFLANIQARLPDLVPRFRQIVVPARLGLGHPTWQHDPHFDIRRHIIPVRLRRPGSESQLEAFAGRTFSAHMDRGKPLWDLHIIQGLRDGRGALMIRFHHAMADGISGTELLQSLLDTTARPPRPARRPAVHMPPAAAPGTSLFDSIGAAIHGTLDNLISAEANLLGIMGALSPSQMKDDLARLLGVFPELAVPVQRLPFNRPCGAERKFCWTEVPFTDLQAIRAAAGGTINDVVLAVLTRALARYVKLHGEGIVNRQVRIVCPVNVRPGGQCEVLGNQITFLPVLLPLDVSDPLRNLRAVAARLAALKTARAANFVALLGNWIGAAPPPLQALFWGGLPVFPLPVPILNMICTNVPGWRMPLYAAGSRMLAFYPQVPTGYDLGVGIAAQSYDGKLFFGLTSDADAAPDAHRLRDFLRMSFEELCRAAGLKTPRRRTPAPKSATMAAHAAM